MKKSILAFLSILCLAGTAAAQQGWVQLTSGTPNRLQFISTVGSDTIFVSGDELLRSTNAGASWEKLANPPAGINRVGIVRFIDGMHGWIGNGDSVWRTTNGGNTWVGSFTKSPSCEEMNFSSLDSGCIMGNLNARTTDGGVTWQPSNTASENCMAFMDAAHGFIMGRAYPWPDTAPPYTSAAVWLATSDGGLTWPAGGYAHPSADGKHSGISTDVFGVAVLNPDTVIAVGLQIGRTFNGGAVWDTIAYPGDGFNTLLAVYFSDHLHGTSVGTSGWIFHTTDGGSTWQRQNSGITGTTFLNAVSFIDTLTGYAVGDAGIILKTTNAGLSWVNISPLSSNFIPATSYPQPANSGLSLDYNLPEAQHVNLSIQNVTGAIVEPVLNGSLQTDGIQSVKVNTSPLASGTYTYVLQSEKYYATGKIEVIH